MTWTIDPRRRSSPGVPDRDESPWDEELAAFADVDAALRPGTEASKRARPEEAPTTDPLADFFQDLSRELAVSPRPEVRRAEETAQPPDEPHRVLRLVHKEALGTLVRISVSLVCLAGGVAVAVGYLWPETPASVGDSGGGASSPSDLHARPLDLGQWQTGTPSLPAPHPPTREPMPAASAALPAPPRRAAEDAARRTSSPVADLNQPGRSVDAPTSDAVLTASPVDTWSALATRTAPVAADETRPAPVADASVLEAAGGEEARADRAAINQLLRAYEQAYDRRDVAAVAALWPSMDAPGFTRAFNSVKRQDLTFQGCNVVLKGDEASVECPGEIQYVRQVGGDAPQTRRAVWTLTVIRTDDHWQVGDVVVR